MLGEKVEAMNKFEQYSAILRYLITNAGKGSDRVKIYSPENSEDFNLSDIMIAAQEILDEEL